MLNIQEAVKICFLKYVTFSGRAPRAEFWWFVLFCFIFEMIAGMIYYYLYIAVLLAFLLPHLAVSVRRLHDTSRTGWWLLLLLIPIIGQLILIFFFIGPSEPANEYGPPPVY